MEKPKILGMKSEDYPEGRIDSFRIDERSGKWKSIVDCLVDLGFSEEAVLSKIDVTLEHRDYLFLYLNSKLKVHLSAEGSKDSFVVRVDTSLPRSKIIRSFEKHFQFPEQ